MLYWFCTRQNELREGEAALELRGRERNSSLELLRIIGIFLVILRHYCEGSAGYDTIAPAAWTWRVAFLQVNTAWGLVANNIFTLISGYFMIGRKLNGKRIVLLLAEMFFYSWVIMILIYGFGVLPFSLREMIRQLFPVWFANTWYVNCYLVLCCFLPFLNPFLDGLSRENYLRFLLVATLLWSVAFTLGATTFIGGWASLDHFIIMYAFGGYFRKFGVPSKIPWRTVFFCSAAVELLSVLALSFGRKLMNEEALFASALYFTTSNNIVCVATSLSLFLWAVSAKPFYSRAINTAAQSVLGIFLIHYNPLLRGILWSRLFPNADYADSNALLLHCLIKVSAVFAVCLAIDRVRILTVDRAFRSFLDRHWDDWRGRLSRLEARCIESIRSA